MATVRQPRTIVSIHSPSSTPAATKCSKESHTQAVTSRIWHKTYCTIKCCTCLIALQSPATYHSTKCENHTAINFSGCTWQITTNEQSHDAIAMLKMEIFIFTSRNYRFFSITNAWPRFNRQPQLTFKDAIREVVHRRNVLLHIASRSHFSFENVTNAHYGL